MKDQNGRVAITGTGASFPERRFTNADLASLVDTSDAWIRERTGIVERRIVTPGRDAEHNSALAASAANAALQMAGKRADELDAIFYATCTPDTLIPSTTCWLQQRLGASRAWGFDINAACSGFLFAVTTAQQFLTSGSIDTALVVGADVLSAFTNYEDRGSCILFGDGAGAVILERAQEDGRGILATRLMMDGSRADLFHIPAGGSNLEVTPERAAEKLHKMHMRGPELFKVAVKTLADNSAQVLSDAGVDPADVTWLIPHQANMRIVEAAASRLGIGMDRVLTNVERCGNTSAATIPTVLDEDVRAGRIRRGDLLLFAAFGAGLTGASVLMRW
jgi:3-oxoacyl-[acyl-carrier-protein] synthase-3